MGAGERMLVYCTCTSLTIHKSMALQNAPSYLSFDLTVVASTSLAKSTQIICRMGERRFSASMHKY